jgi:hypothetical protein
MFSFLDESILQFARNPPSSKRISTSTYKGVHCWAFSFTAEAPAMVLRHDGSSRSEVSADLLTPRFEIQDQGCLTFTISAVNQTAISISRLSTIQQLTDLRSGLIGDVHIQKSPMLQINVPVENGHHYVLFSVRKRNSNFIMIDDVQLAQSACGKQSNIYIYVSKTFMLNQYVHKTDCN